MGKRTVMMELGAVSMMLLVCAAIMMLVIDSKQASGKLERGGTLASQCSTYERTFGRRSNMMFAGGSTSSKVIYLERYDLILQ